VSALTLRAKGSDQLSAARCSIAFLGSMHVAELGLCGLAERFASIDLSGAPWVNWALDPRGTLDRPGGADSAKEVVRENLGLQKPFSCRATHGLHCR
jgi:hypothetical protein